MDELQAKLDGTWEPEPVDTPLNSGNIHQSLRDMIDANDAAGIDFKFPDWA